MLVQCLHDKDYGSAMHTDAARAGKLIMVTCRKTPYIEVSLQLLRHSTMFAIESPGKTNIDMLAGIANVPSHTSFSTRGYLCTLLERGALEY